MESNIDIIEKLQEAEKLIFEPLIAVTFEPFSYLIVQELQKMKTRAERNRLYESIFQDPRTEIINETNAAKTSLFPNHNTKDKYWGETKNIAFALNNYGIDICFLPELGDIPKNVKRADAIIKVNNIWTIADFKYFQSLKGNTLSTNLEEGFMQAKTIILKIENANTGALREAIDYLKRNKKQLGDIVLVNEYNRMLYISAKQINTDRYRHLLKGFL